jgi:hypothetical protein
MIGLLKKSKTKYLPTSPEAKFISDVMDKLQLDKSLEASDLEMLTGIFNQVSKLIDNNAEAQNWVHKLLDIVADEWKAVR